MLGGTRDSSLPRVLVLALSGSFHLLIEKRRKKNYSYEVAQGKPTYYNINSTNYLLQQQNGFHMKVEYQTNQPGKTKKHYRDKELDLKKEFQKSNH